MALQFACVIFASGTVTDEALSRGFAVATAGFDLDAARLTVGSLDGLAGFDVAFYASGRKHEAYLELDHVEELFEEELPPGLAVLDHARRSPGSTPVQRVYSLVYDDASGLDDACVFDDDGFRRSFVRQGDDGPVAGSQTNDGEPTEQALSEEEAEGPHPSRGSLFLAQSLGQNLLVALSRALFTADRVVRVSLAGSGEEAARRATRALITSLKRTEGRGAPSPERVAGLPAELRAFAVTYDWADPTDPGDVYRELAIGRIVGNATFKPLRASLAEPPAQEGGAGHVPVLSLTKGALGGGGAGSVARYDVATGLLLDERGAPLGPTWCELLTYLALGFGRRDDVEEDWIQALLLRAAVRSS